MKGKVEKWIKIALVNFCIVALLGVTLRYKILFSLPFLNQKNLIHAHSHFAFAGWITQALMILLVYYLYKQKQENLFKRYGWVLFSNLTTAFGMLIVFSIQGYAFYSILFSVLSILVSYIFAAMFWGDLNKLNLSRNSHLWFKASLLFSVISSFGPYCLAFIMANHISNSKLYLASVYFFLHFQYNGWFLFACMGLLISKLFEFTQNEKRFKYIFWIFALSCVPSYFLSALWLPIHSIVYIIVVVCAVMQFIAWLSFLKIILRYSPELKNEIFKQGKWLMILAAISMTIKLILQLGSTYPALSRLAFGFRPIVIGYLHLVFLALVSIFIIGNIISEKLLIINRTVITGVAIFVSGVFINEVLLMFQGFFALAAKSLPYINLLLLIAAVIIFTGIYLIMIKQFRFYFPGRKDI